MTGILANFLLFIILILVQSFILNTIGFFDILLVWILFFFTTHNVKYWVLILAFIAGCIMDSTSGGVFGVYISSYLWFFALLFSTSKYLNINNYILILFLGVCGILIENLFIFFSNYLWKFAPVIVEGIYSRILLEFIFCIIFFLPLYLVLMILRLMSFNFLDHLKLKLHKLSRI